jgi:hypothetical protein
MSLLRNDVQGAILSPVIKPFLKIVLQNAKTKAFYSSAGDWVKNVDDSREFSNSDDALNLCEEFQLKDTYGLILFPNGRELPFLSPL